MVRSDSVDKTSLVTKTVYDNSMLDNDFIFYSFPFSPITHYLFALQIKSKWQLHKWMNEWFLLENKKKKKWNGNKSHSTDNNFSINFECNNTIETTQNFFSLFVFSFYNYSRKSLAIVMRFSNENKVRWMENGKKMVK